ncbi:lipopolysaccharide core heptose(I) kinase RfaP [Porticoccaceae bacterium LTM1]|nr:lipopolysaccharide core heptose(I) kinase RfaP [Porticoccaceae bacterium LTM1]
MKLWLREEFAKEWQEQDPFACADQLEGKVYRALEGRKTLRFELSGNSYFIKIHKGIGWGEIVKNLTQGRLPILGAGAEYRAINRLHELGVDTMTAAAFGERGVNPATQQSFLVTEDLAGSISLEDFCGNWQEQPPKLKLKRALIKKVATISAQLHNHGVNHRDYYICHFHLYPESLQEDHDNIRLHVIDLHRTQLRNRTPYRWRLKDLAGLYFSAMDVGLTRGDRLCFLKHYFQSSLKMVIRDQEKLLSDVERKAQALYEREQRKRRG